MVPKSGCGRLPALKGAALPLVPDVLRYPKVGKCRLSRPAIFEKPMDSCFQNMQPDRLKPEPLVSYQHAGDCTVQIGRVDGSSAVYECCTE
jgi:hypothetical protein